MQKYPVDILICLNALFTMEYYKNRRVELEPVSDAEYDKAITALSRVSDTVWDNLHSVIENEPDSYVSRHKLHYREYCKDVLMLRELS